jgi:hypothetical protein
MSPVDCLVGVGAGDAVVWGTEVTGVVPSDPGGVMVQPRTMTNETSIKKMQMVLMDKVNLDILLHHVALVHYF